MNNSYESVDCQSEGSAGSLRPAIGADHPGHISDDELAAQFDVTRTAPPVGQPLPCQIAHEPVLLSIGASLDYPAAPAMFGGRAAASGRRHPAAAAADGIRAAQSGFRPRLYS